MFSRIFEENYKLLVFGSILLLGLFIYSNAFYSPFYFDDSKFIVNNPIIRDLNLRDIWDFAPTRLFVFISLALNYHFHQLNVAGYHLFNLAVHLGAACLVWWLVTLIFRSPRAEKDSLYKHSRVIALFSALIFLSHPLQTESVTYIWQRCTSMAGFFYLLSVCLYMRTRLLQIESRKFSAWIFPYVFSLVFAGVSILTKENTITLPAAVFLCELCFFKPDKLSGYKYAAPFVLFLPVIPVMLYLTHTFSLKGSGVYLATQLRVIVSYIRLAFIPLGQNLDYDYPAVQSLFALPALGSLALLAGILAAVIRVFSKHRIIAFSVIWFFLTLLPDSSFVPLEDAVFEHRLYLSLAGFSLFLAALVVYLFGKKPFKTMIAVLLALTCVYAGLTYRRNFIWQDEIAMWNDVVSKSPNKARPYYNRGVVYWSRGNTQAAIADFSQAIMRNPRNYSIAYYNRGVAFEEQGNLRQAIADYSMASLTNPGLAEPLNNRGGIFMRLGDFSRALADFNQAIQVNPKLAEAYVNRGALYAGQGDLARAIADFTKSIQINPGYVIAYPNRANAYAALGNFNQALADFAGGIRINPAYAGSYIHRGNLYFKLKEYDKAWADVRKAQELGYTAKPEFIAALQAASGREK